MIRRLLVANRGEIAVRILRTAAEMRIATVAVAAEDDRAWLALAHAGTTVQLAGSGPAAYLDVAQILAAARDHGCDAVHPGYGFLSENAEFAIACKRAGLVFVGPTPEHLSILGNKAQARVLAERCGVPVLRGSADHCSIADIRRFMAAHPGPVMIKAVSGGGGRGIRIVQSGEQLEEAYERCRSEARRAFGDDRLYVEQALADARHIEVQVAGDGSGEVVHLGERDCTLQRRHQKLIEITPSPVVDDELRSRLTAAALRMAGEIRYLNLGTFEFLVDTQGPRPTCYFLEANPRLQVEHTVTEDLWGVDLVEVQLMLAAGTSLAQAGLTALSPSPGFAIQARVNAERLLPEGMPVAEGGTITRFEPPTGPGIRIDTHAYRGAQLGVAYDSLLAKVIVNTRSPEFGIAVAKMSRALGDFRIDGTPTNLAFLRAVLAEPQLVANRISTRFIDTHLAELLARADDPSQQAAGSTPVPATDARAPTLQPDERAIVAPTTGLIVALQAAGGEVVSEGQAIAVVEAMKMEHGVLAPAGGVLERILVRPGAAVVAGELLGVVRIDTRAGQELSAARPPDPNVPRADLQEMTGRQRLALDESRPEAVARRRAKHSRTARENIAALCDAGSFLEYGSLVVAAQRRRRSLDELMRKTPADGLVAGFGTVNGELFSKELAQSLVIAFDDTVLAGTMGEMAREKLKHCLEVARQARRPVILFAEGGGGRAGDTDLRVAVTGWTMDVSSYFQLGRMSGLTPLIGIVHGHCFAANAGMLACCDVIIATERSNIGVGGPSMIAGGRLGSYTAEQIGPAAVQTLSGVIDLLVADEASAVATAKQYLAYFQGPLSQWAAPDPSRLRQVVPENRLRAYEVRDAIHLLADTDSVLELRRGFGIGIVTCLIRVEGKPLGLIANNPLHLGGAIDSEAADKASRFMKLCEAFGLPILMLCDTPGVMVGPEAEKTGTVRKMGRMFVTAANLTVPFFTIVLRKGYGIGGILMAGGWFKAPRFVVSWPTGEFGGMNIEGNVALAHAAELAAIADPAERRARFDALVLEMHAVGRALQVATHFEVDNVIDPADSRAWISMAMTSHRPRLPGSDKTVPFVDPW